MTILKLFSNTFWFDFIGLSNDLLLVYISTDNDFVPLNNNSDTISDMQNPSSTASLSAIVSAANVLLTT